MMMKSINSNYNNGRKLDQVYNSQWEGRIMQRTYSKVTENK